ncbi:methyl-CpG-binding domain-containing protein 10-like [Camellia sinensis]|uniref:methyl-CpG-binding domain-containing protein 10-like n=1 Tax=Camellia sinensis TaxID=4442 RepID=UPI001036B17C|nr:methyl-CpG-binding domain-containing protein 10-like [Camellia sinensis]
MGRPKPIAVDLLADLPANVDTVPAQSMPPPKPKRVKKAQPKGKAAEVEAEDALPISQLAENKNSTSTSAKRSAEAHPSGSTQSKKTRSSSATTSGSKKPDVPWAPKLTLEDRPIMSTESADDINAEAATKAQQMAEEKTESAEAIKKVAEAEKKDAEVKKAQAEKELKQALATKNAEITEVDEKAYAQGMADVAEDYKLQVMQACNRGFSLGWMSLAKKLNVPEDSPLLKAEAIPLPFPPPAPSSSQAEDEAESEAEDEDNNEDEALGDKVREAPREAVTGILSSDLLLAERSLDKTLTEIDAELEAEKIAEEVPPESFEVPAPPTVNVEES